MIAETYKKDRKLKKDMVKIDHEHRKGVTSIGKYNAETIILTLWEARNMYYRNTTLEWRALMDNYIADLVDVYYTTFGEIENWEVNADEDSD